MRSVLLILVAALAVLMIVPAVQACPQQLVQQVGACGYTQAFSLSYAQPLIQPVEVYQAPLPVVQAQYQVQQVQQIQRVVQPVNVYGGVQTFGVKAAVVQPVGVAVVPRPGQVRRASRQAVRSSLRSSVVVSPVVVGGVVAY